MLSPTFDADMVALHRYAVIAEALPDRLTPAERGHLVRMIAMRTHVHADGTERRYSRGTVDRWIRDWRRDSLPGLRPSKRADIGTVRAHPELADVVAALRIELPGRSAAQIADIVWHRHSVRISERTIRAWLSQPRPASRSTRGGTEGVRPFRGRSPEHPLDH